MELEQPAVVLMDAVAPTPETLRVDQPLCRARPVNLSGTVGRLKTLKFKSFPVSLTHMMSILAIAAVATVLWNTFYVNVPSLLAPIFTPHQPLSSLLPCLYACFII